MMGFEKRRVKKNVLKVVEVSKVIYETRMVPIQASVYIHLMC